MAGVLLDAPHSVTVVAQSEVRLLSIHKVDIFSVGDAGVIERLTQVPGRLARAPKPPPLLPQSRPQSSSHATHRATHHPPPKVAKDFPSDAEICRRADTAEHWRSYKADLVTGVIDIKRSRKWSCGARPGIPERDEVLRRSRTYEIPKVVFSKSYIAADSFSTPVPKQDLTTYYSLPTTTYYVLRTTYCYLPLLTTHYLRLATSAAGPHRRGGQAGAACREAQPRPRPAARRLPCWPPRRRELARQRDAARLRARRKDLPQPAPRSPPSQRTRRPRAACAAGNAVGGRGRRPAGSG